MSLRKKRRIRFTDKKHPIQGILSTIMGILTLVILLLLFFVSGKAKGNADLMIGLAGILDMIASAVGFVLARRCYKKEDIYMTTPAVGSFINALVFLALLILYIVGLI